MITMRLCGRFTRFLLFLGYSATDAAELKVQSLCRTVSAFAMEYRTAREKLIQQRQKAASQQARKASRGFITVDVRNYSSLIARNLTAPSVALNSLDRFFWATRFLILFFPYFFSFLGRVLDLAGHHPVSFELTLISTVSYRIVHVLFIDSCLLFRAEGRLLRRSSL